MDSGYIPPAPPPAGTFAYYKAPEPHSCAYCADKEGSNAQGKSDTGRGVCLSHSASAGGGQDRAVDIPVSGFQRARNIDAASGLELRPRTVRHCPQPGCDWYLVTSYFVGGPDRVRVVPKAEQQAQAGLHMREHFPPPRTFFV